MCVSGVIIHAAQSLLCVIRFYIQAFSAVNHTPLSALVVKIAMNHCVFGVVLTVPINISYLKINLASFHENMTWLLKMIHYCLVFDVPGSDQCSLCFVRL